MGEHKHEDKWDGKIDDKPFMKEKKKEYLSNFSPYLPSGVMSFLQDSKKVDLVKPLHEKVWIRGQIIFKKGGMKRTKVAQVILGYMRSHDQGSDSRTNLVKKGENDMNQYDIKHSRDLMKHISHRKIHIFKYPHSLVQLNWSKIVFKLVDSQDFTFLL